MPVFPYRLMLDLLVNSNLLRIRNCLVVSLNSLVSTPPPHIQRQACSLVSVGGVEELCHAKDCWAWQRQLGDVAQWQPSPLENQIGHRYLTNEYVNLLKCWSWSWFDPRSCQQKLGKQRNHSFFLCKNNIKIIKIRKSSYTATLTTLARLAMIHCLALVAVNVEVSTQEAFVAYMSPGVVSTHLWQTICTVTAL